MGWASGCEILDEIANAVMPLISKTDRAKAAEKLITIFENQDCDTVQDCYNKEIQKAFKKLYPDED